MVCMGVVVAGWNTVVRIPRSVVSIIAPVAVPAVGERNSKMAMSAELTGVDCILLTACNIILGTSFCNGWQGCLNSDVSIYLLTPVLQL